MSDTAPPPPTKTPEVFETKTKGGKHSAWMTHVKKTMRANKGKPLSAVLKMAKKTYKKTKKGGASITPALVGGKRRSRSRSRRA